MTREIIPLCGKGFVSTSNLRVSLGFLNLKYYPLRYSVLDDHQSFILVKDALLDRKKIILINDS